MNSTTERAVVLWKPTLQHLAWLPAPCWGRHQRHKLSDESRFDLKRQINEFHGRPRETWRTCQSCGLAEFGHRHSRKRARLQIDHIIAISRGGCNHLHNLQLLCAACNNAKSNRLPWEVA